MYLLHGVQGGLAPCVDSPHGRDGSCVTLRLLIVEDEEDVRVVVGRKFGTGG
jgi:hypothetical protein